MGEKRLIKRVIRGNVEGKRGKELHLLRIGWNPIAERVYVGVNGGGL